MIKIEHTLFSLPFVLSAAFLAVYSKAWQVNYMSFLWIALCLLGARSAGMSLNRIIDASIDAANPRTADREIPQGKITKAQAYLFTVISILVLAFSAFQLPKLCQYLLPIPIIWVWLYPYLKRFTWFAHLFLGTTLGGATLGGWIAITGSIESLAPVYLALAVTFWTAGFDIIYATQDYEYDKSANLKSIPAVFGLSNALKIARFAHFLTPVFLYLAGLELSLGFYYKLGVAATVLLLLYEQKLVKENKIEKAFFTINTWISVLILFFVILEILIK